jgi:hypothetical protein
VTRRALVALLFAALLGGAPALASGHEWLLGRWELTHDPQGDAKDWLEFHPDGRAVSVSPNGRRIPGEYVVGDGEIRVVYSFAGRQIPITLKHSPDRAKLFAPSARTGTASTYEKVK